MTEGENMVERCARAVCCPDGCIGSVGVIPCNIAGEDRTAMRQASAVIKALMEPTPQMLEAAVMAHFEFLASGGAPQAANFARFIFQAMLRTALSQPNEEGEGK